MMSVWGAGSPYVDTVWSLAVGCCHGETSMLGMRTWQNGFTIEALLQLTCNHFMIQFIREANNQSQFYQQQDLTNPLISSLDVWPIRAECFKKPNVIIPKSDYRLLCSWCLNDLHRDSRGFWDGGRVCGVVGVGLGLGWGLWAVEVGVGVNSTF